MPAGSLHDRITLWTLPGIVAATVLISRHSTVALAVGSAYLFSGVMFSGDLDTYSRQYQRWGWLRWIWLPYRHLMRHRSFWSHGPVVGTIGRIIYLGGWIGLVALGIAGVGYWLGSWGWQPQVWGAWLKQWLWLHIELLAWIGMGLELGSMNHTLSDWTVSSWKRWQRSRSRRRALPRSKPRNVSSR